MNLLLNFLEGCGRGLIILIAAAGILIFGSATCSLFVGEHRETEVQIGNPDVVDQDRAVMDNKY